MSFHEILAARHVLDTRARELTPAPRSRTHGWSPIGAVTINPEGTLGRHDADSGVR